MSENNDRDANYEERSPHANEPPTEAQLDALRVEHGPLIQVEAAGIHVVLAKPAKANIGGVYMRFMEKAAKPETKAEAAAGLFKACVVYPSKETVTAMLADEPGLAVSFGAHATSLIGVREAKVKKA